MKYSRGSVTHKRGRKARVEYATSTSMIAAVLGLLMLPAGSSTPRAPGSDGHQCAADDCCGCERTSSAFSVTSHLGLAEVLERERAEFNATEFTTKNPDAVLDINFRKQRGPLVDEIKRLRMMTYLSQLYGERVDGTDEELRKAVRKETANARQRKRRRDQGAGASAADNARRVAERRGSTTQQSNHHASRSAARQTNPGASRSACVPSRRRTRGDPSTPAAADPVPRRPLPGLNLRKRNRPTP